MSQKQRLIEYWTSSGIIKDKKVIEAFKKVPREAFLKDRKEGAYGDYPLPIEGGQTISQPTTVMIMTEALELKKGHKVLEIGSGSGYQAAIISKIIGNGGKLISTEIIPELAEFARKNKEYRNNKARRLKRLCKSSPLRQDYCNSSLSGNSQAVNKAIKGKRNHNCAGRKPRRANDDKRD